MEGTICGINASVYDPLLACLHKMHGARKSRTLARTGSTLSITKTMKYRPCYILKANPMANFTTVCFMATFGGADYDDLADITQRLVRPVQHNHPSFSEAATIHLTPAWPREPQWMICWATDVASALSLWSGAGDVPYSTDAATVHKLQRDVWNLEIKLMKAASADCNLARRLQADLMNWKRAHEAKGEGSIYSQAPKGSQGSLASARSYVSSSCSASTSSLVSIPEVSEGEDWGPEEVPTPTPTGTTFAGKILKNMTRASHSSRLSKRPASSAKDHFMIQDPPMKRTNASRVSFSSCRSQGSGKNCWTQGGPPAIRAM